MSGTYQGMINQPNGLAGLDGSGLLLPSQLPLATSSSVGMVQPDNSSIFIDGSGVISAWNGWRTTYDSGSGASFSNGQTITLISGQYYDSFYIYNGIFTIAFNGSGTALPGAIVNFSMLFQQGFPWASADEFITSQVTNSADGGLGLPGTFGLLSGGYLPGYGLTFTFNTDMPSAQVTFRVQ